MDIGTLAGVVILAAVGVILWKAIQKKCQKEVKVYGAENISSPTPKDKGAGRTKPRTNTGTAGKPGTGKTKGRKSVQVKSSPKSKQHKRKNDGDSKAAKPDSIRIPRVQPI